ncbi:hypothetical protein [Priestia koreensis]|uniref:Glycosyl transferase family 28 C-terminal domain-containing protein n=1 Tax=Priestia koreensis TaxID=284581 RepID=A0A0M0LIA4_9BACI|nr:hypothetical protein [Priestia koreensis]KOO50433.1 hypothetical protein AMD01_01365 [Priestia koreensis]
MKKIAYYISDYGYGHAARSIAIIRELLKQYDDVEVVICHSFALAFLQQSLPQERVTYRRIQTDIGYILKAGSLEPDGIEIEKGLREFLEDDHYLIEEMIFLKEMAISFVLSDVSFIGIAAAYEIGIPSLVISNFTWATAYDGLIDRYLHYYLRNQYMKTTHFFRLAGSTETDHVCEGHLNLSFDFLSRQIEKDEVQRIRTSLSATSDKAIVYVGLGMKVNVGDVNSWSLWDSPNCTFIVSSTMDVQHHNVVSIPTDYIESQHYIAAADIAITKSGWGTISEAILGETSLLVVERQSLREDRDTIAYLKERNLCEVIHWDALPDFVLDEKRISTLKEKQPQGWLNETSSIVKRIGLVLESSE